MKQAACRLKTEGSLVASCCAGASDWKHRYLEPDIASLALTVHTTPSKVEGWDLARTPSVPLPTGRMSPAPVQKIMFLA